MVSWPTLYIFTQFSQPEATVAGASGAVDSGMVPRPKSASHHPQKPSIRASWERDGKDTVKFKPQFFSIKVGPPKTSVLDTDMDVSENSGFSLQNHPFFFWFSIINHPFWGTSIFGNIHIWIVLLTHPSPHWLLAAHNLKVTWMIFVF